MAALACGGAAAPVAARGSKAHHTARCQKEAAKWKKAHKHPTAKQRKHENKFLAKYRCPNRV
jgi:hypothetical protein